MATGLFAPAHLLVIFVVGLLVLGPDKLPEIAQQAGRAMREFRRVQQHLRTELGDVMTMFDGDTNDSTTSPPTLDGEAVPGPAPDTAASPHSVARGERVWPPSPTEPMG